MVEMKIHRLLKIKPGLNIFHPVKTKKRKKLCVCTQTSAVWLCERAVHVNIHWLNCSRSKGIGYINYTRGWIFLTKRGGKTIFSHHYCQRCRPGDFSLCGLAMKSSSFFLSFFSRSLVCSKARPHISFLLSRIWKLINLSSKVGFELWRGCHNPRWWSI